MKVARRENDTALKATQISSARPDTKKRLVIYSRDAFPLFALAAFVGFLFSVYTHFSKGTKNTLAENNIFCRRRHHGEISYRSSQWRFFAKLSE